MSLGLRVNLTIIVLIFLGLACSRGREAEIQMTPVGQTTTTPESQAETTPPAKELQEAAVDTTVAEPVETWGWIKNEWVNVRSEPTTRSAKITQLSRGARVKLLVKEENWWLVELDDGTQAYVYSPLVHLDRYVDPWTAFKMGCRLTDTSLAVISGVTEYKDKQTPSAFLIVADYWSDLTKIRQIEIIESAFSYWQKCLQQSGFELDSPLLIIGDTTGRELVRATRKPGSSLPRLSFID